VDNQVRGFQTVQMHLSVGHSASSTLNASAAQIVDTGSPDDDSCSSCVYIYVVILEHSYNFFNNTNLGLRLQTTKVLFLFELTWSYDFNTDLRYCQNWSSMHLFTLNLIPSISNYFMTRIAGPAHFDPFWLKIEHLYFVTFLNYTHRPF
jgi:hypothetical protein